eukprot:SAG11_NODE_15547_length_574_cov_1.223158_1_plen_80_part_00
MLALLSRLLALHTVLSAAHHRLYDTTQIATFASLSAVACPLIALSLPLPPNPSTALALALALTPTYAQCLPLVKILGIA